MPNGNKPGPATAERIREQGAKHGRLLQKAIDQARGEMVSDWDESSEVKAGPVHARLGLPRPARMAIGFALAFLIITLGATLVLKLL